VSLRHDQTSVTFFSHEAAVRDAIESALPRLREMLNDQGINLNQVQMSDQSLSRQQAGAGDQPANGQRNGRWPMSAPVSEPGVDAVESQPRPRSRWGRVDDYA
jgi:flagellar hook-length control protein FliK